jgi:1-acyl-sn-glycerol-3-phosphate acyltransferase
MAAWLGAVRSTLAVLLIAVWFAVPGTALFYLGVLPLIGLMPQRRVALISWFMKVISHGILGLLRLGGARFERRGRLPTGRPGQPILVLMNHQSLVDIPTATVMSEGPAPAFVTRNRYRRFIPLVSPSIRLLGCPIIDPRRDPRGAMAAIERVARQDAASLLIFPEGHRSRDGRLGPFKAAGTLAALRGRPMPIYLVVTDGMWASRRFVDFVVNVHRVRGVTEVMGPFDPPAAEDVPAFVERARALMAERLEGLRQEHATA